MSERMTNPTLRDRFKLPESKSAIASQIISATMETGLVKQDEAAGASRKFARSLPYWA
jgi:ATP-dependent DNA helicase RecG